MLCHGGFNDGWNIQEGDHAIEERLHRNFIGRVQHRRHCTPSPSCLKGQAQTRKALWIGRIELQRLHFEQVKRWQGIGQAFWIGQGIGNRDTHVGDPQLRQHRAVMEFDHGMDDTLGMHDDLHLLDRDVKQMMCLNDLKAFIHHRR